MKNDVLYTLFVNSLSNGSDYWIECKDHAGNVEHSQVVHSWQEAVTLLEYHNWTAYEMVEMENLYFDLILEAKRKRGFRSASSQQRFLEILRRLQNNEVINVDNAVLEFNKGRHQIHRDINAIREYLEYSNKTVDYSKSKNGYVLNTKGDYFTVDDALIVLLLLYGTRALNKKELKSFTDKMINLFSRPKQIKMKDFFQSYLFHYKPVQDHDLLELLYTCFQAISQKQLLTFTYINNQGVKKEHEVIPFTITYHDRKFYLHARINREDRTQLIPWQIDRMENCTLLKKSFSKPLSEMEVGEYIQKSFNMYHGDLATVKMKVKQSNVSFLKRNFPDVKITPSDHEEWVMADVEVLGFMGIKLWILQQGPYVEVVEPVELREEVKQLIQEMYHMYFEHSNV